MRYVGLPDLPLETPEMKLNASNLDSQSTLAPGIPIGLNFNHCDVG